MKWSTFEEKTTNQPRGIHFAILDITACIERTLYRLNHFRMKLWSFEVSLWNGNFIYDRKLFRRISCTRGNPVPFDVHLFSRTLHSLGWEINLKSLHSNTFLVVTLVCSFEMKSQSLTICWFIHSFWTMNSIENGNLCSHLLCWTEFSTHLILLDEQRSKLTTI